MPRYVAFLRAVNVGGASTVKMEVLRGVFQELGFSGVSSFIASGNIVFETRTRKTELLEKLIEGGLLQALGKDLTPFVRTGPELTSIVRFNAFPKSTLGAGDQLAVVFLSAPPAPKAGRSLEAFPSRADEFRVHGREIYWLRHREVEGVAYSTVPLGGTLVEPFTIRSMSTLKKLVDKYFAHE